MIVICEQCGKKYTVNPEMLRQATTRLKCKACNHAILVAKPRPVPAPPAETHLEDFVEEVPEETEAAAQPETAAAAAATSAGREDTGRARKLKGLGLRPKMLLLFVAIPLLAFAAVGVFQLVHMNRFASAMTLETSQSVTRSGEEYIKRTARSVARQCKEYLLAHPEITESAMMNDVNFRQVAVQRVGLTGYTAFYATDPMTLWAHPDGRLVGQPLTGAVKDYVGKDLDRWLRIVGPLDRGENTENAGYYLWVDSDGILREKYMVVTPLEGTRYGVTATIYMEEFLRPVKKVENTANRMTLLARNYFIYSLAGVLVVIGCVVSIYSYRLTRSINTITDHALRISLGDMDAKLHFQSKDELGSLGEAIGLMQNSIRIAIERLRRRR